MTALEAGLLTGRRMKASSCGTSPQAASEPYTREPSSVAALMRSMSSDDPGGVAMNNGLSHSAVYPLILVRQDEA